MRQARHRPSRLTRSKRLTRSEHRGMMCAMDGGAGGEIVGVSGADADHQRVPSSRADHDGHRGHDKQSGKPGHDRSNRPPGVAIRRCDLPVAVTPPWSPRTRTAGPVAASWRCLGRARRNGGGPADRARAVPP